MYAAGCQDPSVSHGGKVKVGQYGLGRKAAFSLFKLPHVAGRGAEYIMVAEQYSNCVVALGDKVKREEEHGSRRRRRHGKHEHQEVEEGIDEPAASDNVDYGVDNIAVKIHVTRR